jgi:predicted alpha/beta superfamily hydrolase
LIFRYFGLPECSGMKLKEGYYEVAYEGVSRYLIKHQSLFYEKEGLFNYKYSPVNYISDGNEFFPVKNKRNLLRVMDEKSKDIKKYIHSSGIRIRQANRNQIVMILKYYDFIKGS